MVRESILKTDILVAYACHFAQGEKNQNNKEYKNTKRLDFA